MTHVVLIPQDCTVVWCNKFEPKSDYFCKNLNPEGKLSNGMGFVDLGECMEIQDENGKFLKMLYHNSDVKKEIMRQYETWKN